MATIKLPNSDQFDTMNTHLGNIVSTATAAIGNRTYTEDNYVTDSETVTASIDALDIQVKDNTDAIAAMLSAVYPIGCVYTSVVSTSPATLFGMGTWAALGAGKVLVGIDAGDADFDTAEETGGAKTHLHTGAAHTHGVSAAFAKIVFGTNEILYKVKSSVATWTSNNKSNPTSSTSEGTFGYDTGLELGGATDAASAANTGSSSSLSPYLVVYRWKRTA